MTNINIVNFLYTRVFIFLLVIVIAQSSAYAASAIVGADANEFLLVDQDWLKKQLDNKSLVILDARSTTEYQKNHIKNAINIPVVKTFISVDPKNKVASIQHIQKLFSEAGIDFEKNIVIYDGGEYINAGRMFWVLEVYGHRRVALLDKGFSGWAQQSLPQSVKTHVLPAKKFIAEVQPDRIKTKLHARLAIDDINTILIDARSVEEYTGKSSKASRAGHIPSAINIPWDKNFKQKNGISTMLGKLELQSLYKDIDNDKKIITYCNKGKHASFSYFVLRQMGFDVSHYDGSWSEWGNDGSLPIE